MTIGEVAKQAGLRPSAIRFYENSGLLPRPHRSGGQRRYDSSILERLAVLRRAKACGFTLSEARQIVDGDGPPAARWQQLAKRKLSQLQALEGKIAAMKNLLDQPCSCSNLSECGRMILESNRTAQ